MDAFAQAVEDARRRLSRLEGHEVSIRDLARRAGLPESTLHYTLKDRPSATGRRRVRLEVVEKLAEVLKPVISRAELIRAAQEIIAVAQALTRDRRHLDGLIAEIAAAPTIVGVDGDVYVRLAPELFAAIRDRINEVTQ